MHARFSPARRQSRRASRAVDGPGAAPAHLPGGAGSWIRRGWPLLAAGLAAVAALAIWMLPEAPEAESAKARPTPAASVTLAPTRPGQPTLTPTATPGCAQAPAPVPPVPTLAALAVREGDPAPAPQPTLTPPPAPLVAGGFLEFPIPYDGTAAGFRAIVNRSTLGGLITSYFDHEYPLYPYSWHGYFFGGSEPGAAPAGGSVLAFDGTRLPEDWYTGHTGFDIAPLPDRPGDTPILAAADGVVERAAVLSDGNHLVELRHTVPGLGEFLTIYMHLQEDAHFQAMRMRVGDAVTLGERIGTMGSTGKSTGTHLHFEVRHDANGDGAFDRQERVDPFGYIPLEGPDPWARPGSWLDEAGRAISHPGIASRYLWRQPLGTTASVGSDGAWVSAGQGGGDLPQEALSGGAMEACIEPGIFAPGSTLLVSWAPDTAPGADQMGTGNGCVVYAQGPAGEPITAFEPGLPVTIPFTPEQIDHVDPDTLTIYLYDSAAGTWDPLPTHIDQERGLAMAEFPRPGRCALRGVPTVDVLPPRSTIALQGDPDESGYYCEPVTVTLSAEDEGDAGVAGIQYSVDFGATWLDYDAPFEVAYQAPAVITPTLATDTEDSVQPEPGERVVLARAMDAEGNVEFPPVLSRIYMACPAMATLSADPPRIVAGCCATLAWETMHGEDVTLNGVAVGGRGDEQVCPSETQTYALRALSLTGEEALAEATVEVLPLDVAFTASAVNLACGQSTTLNWAAPNAREVYLDGARVDNSGSQTICLKAARTFTLRVVPPCGDEIVRSITVNVAALKVAFGADAASVYACQCTALRWDVPSAGAVYLGGDPVERSGAREVCPKETRTYVLRAESGCCDPVEARVTVEARPAPAISFTSDKTEIKLGESVTFRWDMEGVQAVYFEGEGVGGHDSRTVTPADSHTYTLRVVWACGEEIRQIPITVLGDRTPPSITVTTRTAPDYCSYPVSLQARITDASPLRRVQVTYWIGERPSLAYWVDMQCCLPETTNEWYYQVRYQSAMSYEILAEDIYGNVSRTGALPVTCYP